MTMISARSIPALPGMALLLGLAPLLAATPASAGEHAMIAIASFGEYRIDGLREAMFEGKPVRILDLTLINRSTITTFPGTIIEVWWQGKSTGAESIARHRDLSHRGMYEYIKPGQSWQASYIVPVRADIAGIELRFPKGEGMAKRKLGWGELAASGK